jgi:hypothetical protein
MQYLAIAGLLALGLLALYVRNLKKRRVEMAINYHSHLHGCSRNPTVRAICIACKFDAWATAKKNNSVIAKTFEQLLTPKDESYLQAQLISWR